MVERNLSEYSTCTEIEPTTAKLYLSVNIGFRSVNWRHVYVRYFHEGPVILYETFHVSSAVTNSVCFTSQNEEKYISLRRQCERQHLFRIIAT